MKTFRFSILVAILCLLAPAFLPSPAPAADISWVGFRRGIQMAKESDRKVLVYFRTSQCLFCEHMERKTFATMDVADYINDHFVPIHVDADLERDVAASFRVGAFPTCWFLSPKGEPLQVVPGFVPPMQYLDVLEYIETDAYADMSFKAFMQQKEEKKKE
ncbi:MAG: DUF255 domain-containing protein [Desulfobacteraceae bacterium]